MRKSFWEERWRDGRINFHRTEVSPTLLAHHERFLTGSRHRVFLPLCGKSLDLRWLVDRGHEVVGVEFVARAVTDLGAESGFEFRVDVEGDFRVHRAESLTIYVGDFFDLDPATVGTFDRIFDRAALIALAPESRQAYVRRIHEFLDADGRVLLESIHYDPLEMQGPPFAVPPAELESLYARWFRREVLADEPNVDVPPHLRQKGLQRLHRLVTLLARGHDDAGVSH